MQEVLELGHVDGKLTVVPNVDENEQRIQIKYNSERLGIAFGLINIAERRMIKRKSAEFRWTTIFHLRPLEPDEQCEYLPVTESAHTRTLCSFMFGKLERVDEEIVLNQQVYRKSRILPLSNGSGFDVVAQCETIGHSDIDKVGFTGIGFGASYYGLKPIVKSYNALQGNHVIFKFLSIVAIIVFTFRGLKPLKRQSIPLFLNRDNGERETQNCYLKRSSAGKY
ncbi:hypothetical protein ACFE04_026490 [Oxalis oulophora]